jgi:predicted nucleic acid-binding Zn ribbon protein
MDEDFVVVHNIHQKSSRTKKQTKLIMYFIHVLTLILVRGIGTLLQE